MLAPLCRRWLVQEQHNVLQPLQWKNGVGIDMFRGERGSLMVVWWFPAGPCKDRAALYWSNSLTHTKDALQQSGS